MKKNVLYYHRLTEPSSETTARLLATELNQMGFHVLETQSTQPLRLITDQIQLLHMFICKWPLKASEQLLLTAAHWLGLPIVLSIFDDRRKTYPLLKTFKPDLLTVSQTFELSKFRDWKCHKGIIPLLPSFLMEEPKLTVEQTTTSARSTFIVAHESLNELESYHLKGSVFVDARKLVKNNEISALRKKWSQLLSRKPHLKNFGLLTCDESVDEVLNDESLVIHLADPQFTHVEWTDWLNLTVNRGHLVVINTQQATGLSQTWTSGQNCIVCEPRLAKSELSQLEQSPDFGALSTRLKKRETLFPLINEISRQYTKILHQKTSLLSMHSANIKP